MTVIRLHLDEKHDVTASKILDNSRILHDSYSTTDRRAEPSTQGCHPGRSRLPRGQNSEHLPAYDEDASMSNSRMMHVQDFCFHWRALSLYHWHTHKHTYTYTYTDTNSDTATDASRPSPNTPNWAQNRINRRPKISWHGQHGSGRGKKIVGFTKRKERKEEKSHVELEYIKQTTKYVLFCKT